HGRAATFIDGVVGPAHVAVASPGRGWGAGRPVGARVAPAGGRGRLVARPSRATWPARPPAPPRTPQAPTALHPTTPPIPSSLLPTDKASLALMGNPHVVRPVALLDQALEQLARFRARHVGHEVDAARAFDVRDMLPAKGDRSE